MQKGRSVAENKYRPAKKENTATDKGDRKRHRDRKNPGMRDKHAAQRAATNAARPKQSWVGGESVAEGGHWERD
jgi:hypothetical protein